ncbi:monocarboxylate transporter 14 [Elysia marginata]|uniref:Monocarboxylate transporter 14 n=1 Tax=Elysia marginata TaxID=1093978 RepID=A0AAV4IJH6_9GAST|nr:monocarboxylate transporter 14 [Elysia marginata]
MEGGVWGIVIIISAFMIQFLAFGTTATIGVYNIELLEYFPGSTIGVSLIASLNYGIFLGSGFGSCCAYIPSHVLSGMYYDKNRSLATGVATSGSGLGGAVMPVVAGLLIETYSWKGSFIVVAALCLHMFIFSALLRMPPQHSVLEESVVNGGQDASSTPMLPNEEKSQSHSDLQTKNHKIIKSSNLSKNGVDKESKPLISEMGTSEASTTKHPLPVSGDSAVNKDKPAEIKHIKSAETDVNLEKGGSLYPENVSLKSTQGVNAKKPDNISPSKDPVHSHLFKGLNGRSETFSLEDLSVRSRSHTAIVVQDSEQGNRLCHPKLGHTRSGLEHQHNPHGWRLSHSLSSLHTVGTTRGSYFLVLDETDDISSTSQTHASLKEANTKGEGEVHEYKKGEVASSGKRKGPNSARHIYIFTHYGFNIYFLSNIMWNAACSIVSSFAPEYLRSQGLTSMEAAVLLGAFGFGCFVGGVLGGILGNVSWINRQVLYTLANMFMGAVLIAFPSMGHRDLYLICLLMSGLAFGIILGLLIIVLTDLIGIESLSNGLGYLMLSNGIGTFIGPPLAGILKETTGGFESGIILSGVLCVCGGLIMLLMPCRDLFGKLWLACCPCHKKAPAAVEGTKCASC